MAAEKKYFRCAICAKKTSTTNASHAAAQRCAECRAAAESAEARPSPAAAPDAPAGKMTILDAAAVVLGAATEPLRVKEIVRRMLEQNLWTSPNGDTPDQTLCGALRRDVHHHGPRSRFVFAGRGLYAAHRG